MADLFEMGGAANLWLSPQAQEYACHDHAEWASEQVLKTPLPARGTGDDPAYWAARGRVYAKMFRRGWMRLSVYHQEHKLVVDYRRGTKAQWAWVYEKAGTDHLVAVDYADNSVIIDYRARQGPEGSVYGVWEGLDPDDIDFKDFAIQHGAYDWKTRLRVKGFTETAPEHMIVRTGDHLGDKHLSVEYLGADKGWYVGAFQFGAEQGRGICSVTYRTERGMQVKVDELLAAWGLAQPLGEALDPDDPEAFLAQQTDWFQEAREHGYRGTMPDDNPFRNIYEKGWPYTPVVMALYAYQGHPGMVALGLFFGNQLRQTFRVPKARLAEALDWWDTKMDDYDSINRKLRHRQPAPGEIYLNRLQFDFSRWLHGTVAEAMIECLLNEADPDEIDLEGYLKGTLDTNQQMQDLGFQRQRFSQTEGAGNYWMKFYRFDEPIMGNWGSVEAPRLIPVTGFWLYDFAGTSCDREDSKVMAYAWACGQDGESRCPVGSIHVQQLPLVSALRRVVHFFDRFMSSYTTKGKNADKVMDEIHKLVTQASYAQWSHEVTEAVDPNDPDDPQRFIQQMPRLWVLRNCGNPQLYISRTGRWSSWRDARCYTDHEREELNRVGKREACAYWVEFRDLGESAQDPDDPQQFIKRYADERYGALDDLEQWLKVAHQPDMVFQSLALNRKVRLEVMRLINLAARKPYWNVVLYSLADEQCVQHVDDIMNPAMVVPIARRMLEVQAQVTESMDPDELDPKAELQHLESKWVCPVCNTEVYPYTEYGDTVVYACNYCGINLVASELKRAFVSESLDPDEPTPELLQHLLEPLTKDALRARLRALSVMNPWISAGYGRTWDVRGVIFGTSTIWSQIDNALKAVSLHPRNWGVQPHNSMNVYRFKYTPAPHEECWREVAFQLPESEIAKEYSWEFSSSLGEALDPDDPGAFLSNLQARWAIVYGKLSLDHNDLRRMVTSTEYLLISRWKGAEPKRWHLTTNVKEATLFRDQASAQRALDSMNVRLLGLFTVRNLTLSEALDPDDPQEFIKRMPAVMPEWLSAMGFENGSRPQGSAHFTRTVPPTGTITVMQSNKVSGVWYACAYNMPMRERSVSGTSEQVRAKVEEWLKVQQEMLGEASDPDDPATFLGYYKPHTFTLHWDDEAAFEFRHTPGFLSLEAAIEWAREELVHDHSPDVYIDEVDPRDKFNYLRRFWINQEYEVCREEEGSLPLAEALDPDDPESFVRRMPVDMRQWLMQMGFEDHSGSSSVCIAYFVRPRIKNGLLIVKCVSDVNRWYAEAMDDLHTVASARGKPEVVRAEVEKWLQQEAATQPARPARQAEAQLAVAT